MTNYFLLNNIQLFLKPRKCFLFFQHKHLFSTQQKPCKLLNVVQMAIGRVPEINMPSLARVSNSICSAFFLKKKNSSLKSSCLTQTKTTTVDINNIRLLSQLRNSKTLLIYQYILNDHSIDYIAYS